MITTINKDEIEQPSGSHENGPRRNPTAYTKRSARRLAHLGFDPMERMIKLAEKIDRDLHTMRYNPDGTEKRYSQLAYTQMLSIQQKLINDLMRYGYARVPESVQIDTPPPQPMIINLTKKGDTYVPAEHYLPPERDDEYSDED